MTIPRLKLCAAQLLSELVQCFRRASGKYFETFLWSDDKDALMQKTFANNRVQKIQRLTADCTWQHVPSADNPADSLSRGLSPVDLQIVFHDSLGLSFH